MKNDKSRVLAKLARFGVLHREALKNERVAVEQLMRRGILTKTYRQGKVFYELTEQALPLLEHVRRQLLEEVKMRAELDPKVHLYPALVENVRFVDETTPEAEEFLLLGDWHLTRPLVPSQLELAKLRFYQDRVPPRTRTKKAA